MRLRLLEVIFSWFHCNLLEKKREMSQTSSFTFHEHTECSDKVVITSKEESTCVNYDTKTHLILNKLFIFDMATVLTVSQISVT